MPVNKLLIALWGIVAKEWKRFIRIWSQSLLPSAITTTLYFLIFGTIIGSRVGSMGGFGYMVFITPGLIMMAVINNSYSNVASSFYIMRFSGVVDELLASPMPSWLIVLGYALGGLGRGFFVGLIVLALGMCFAGIHMAHPIMMIFILILCSLLFCFTGFLNAIFAKNFDGIMIIPTFVLTPLTYLGGVFYNIKLLPPFWRGLSYFNPIYYIINLFRYAMLNVSETSVAISVIAVILIAAALFVTCWVVLEKGVRIKS